MLALLTAAKWIQANWKLVAIAAILGVSFYGGFSVRGYIAESAQNKAIAAAVAEAKATERKLYDEALEQEKRKRSIRERSRASGVAINSVVGDNCTDSTIPAQWLRIIRDAYSGGTGQ